MLHHVFMHVRSSLLLYLLVLVSGHSASGALAGGLWTGFGG
jgi:hypothetical protein